MVSLFVGGCGPRTLSRHCRDRTRGVGQRRADDGV